MIYKDRCKNSRVQLALEDCKTFTDQVVNLDNVVVVTDPPFNIGYHYEGYKDRMEETQYFDMLRMFTDNFPCVFIHYPEALHRLSIECQKVPEKVVSWVYNSNTAKQHRDIAWYGIKPCFTNALQPYKNPNDKRIKERIARGCRGGRMYDWWNVNQVKNVNREKTIHPCQMPLEVMKNIISTLPEDSIVYDPFMGSGTTAIACIELGYDFIGCEINENYFKAAEERIRCIYEYSNNHLFVSNNLDNANRRIDADFGRFA